MFKFQFDSEEQTRIMSIVSSDDVKNAVICVLKALIDNNEDVNDALCQIYNLTSDANLTLKDLHEQIFYSLFDKEYDFSLIWNEDEHSKNTYPSVHCGAISSAKANSLLGKLGYKPGNIIPET